MERDAAIDETVLLAQRGWVRRLASELVSDAQRAEDLVQDTWRIALERPPASARLPVVRRWLGTVLQNLARKTQRGEAARRWHERRAAETRSEEAPDLDARLELESRLAQALRGLEEPFRETVVLRYLDELSVAQIARRQGTSPANVRQRLSRGLAKLRARLDAGEGGPTGWRAVWLGWLSARRGTPLPTAKEVLGMGVKVKVGVALAAVVCAGVWLVPREESPEVATAPEEVATASPELPAVDAPDAGSAASPEREAVPAAAWVVDRQRDLHGMVLDDAGRPLPGALLRVHESHAAQEPVLQWALRDSTWNPPTPILATAESDALGRFAISLEPGSPYDLEAESPGFANAWSLNRSAGERVEIRLERAATLEGRVVDEVEGKGLADAHVSVGVAEPLRTARFHLASTSTGRDGSYRLADLPPGRLEIRVDPASAAPPPPVVVDLLPGGTAHQDVSVDAGRAVEGRVTDAETGLPITGAKVEANWLGSAGLSVETDEEGRYRIECFPTHLNEGYGPRMNLLLQASSPAYVLGVEVLEPRPPGSPVQALDFALTRGGEVSGRVVDAEGAPVPDAKVVVLTLVSMRIDVGTGVFDRRSTTTDEQGRFAIRGLRTDLRPDPPQRVDPRIRGGNHAPERHALLVHRSGHGSLVYELAGPGQVGEPGDVGDIVLPASGTVRGSVVDDEGKGIPGAYVSAVFHNDGRLRWRATSEEPVVLADTFLATKSVRTDDLGRFTVTDLPPGSVRVNAHRPGAFRRVEESVELGEGEEVQDMVLELPGAETIAGQVATSEGEGIPGAIVYILTGSASGGASVDADVDGHFRADGLLPGEYSIRAHSEAEDVHGADLYMNEDLERVAAGRKDVVITLRRAVSLQGRVLDAAGQPAARVKIVCTSSDYWRALSEYTDESGAFSVALPEGVLFDLVATPRGPGGQFSEPTRVSGVRGGDEGVVVHLR